MEVAVAVEPFDPVDHRQAALDVTGERDRDGTVEPDDRRRVELLERGVHVGDHARLGSLGVAGGDRRLELVRAGAAKRRGALEDTEPFVDRRGVPERPVLVAEEHELPVRTDPRVAARVLEQEQREQAERLGLVGHQHAEELREPDRLGAQLAPDERVAGGRGVPLVEDEVEHAEHVREALGEQVVGRHAERNPRLANAALRADEPLGERPLGNEERAGDLGCREAGDLAQREGHSGVDRERRVAAREEQREALVRDRAHVGVLLGRNVLEPGEQLGLACERPVAPDPVDGAVAGRRHDPGAGRARHAVARPALERLREGVLHRVLGEREITEDAGEDRDGTRPLLAKRRLERERHRSTIGLISIEPYSAVGTSAAMRIASSRSGSVVRKRPPICSFVSANGPSVTTRSPSTSLHHLRLCGRDELPALHVRVGLSHLLEQGEPARHRLGAAFRRLVLAELAPTTTGRCRRAVRTASQASSSSTCTGRTSIAPYDAAGMRAAQSSASSKDAQSRM